MYYLYLLQCRDDSIYTGITKDVEGRFRKHLEKKGGSYTRSHGAKKVIYTERHRTKGRALKRELEVKGWSRERKLLLASKV
jgi:putative endonuclease